MVSYSPAYPRSGAGLGDNLLLAEVPRRERGEGGPKPSIFTLEQCLKQFPFLGKKKINTNLKASFFSV